ncbi:MAG: Cof-type HAD-IIB family hydrolase [Phycisphaeraceae bacterium]|nr:Cof-type HAD-IIB family hydrolase [Phycisphaeraceae bacterium]
MDLDGTLLRSDKKLVMYDAVAVKEAVRRGVKVVLATARPPRSSRGIHNKLGLDTPLINYNGASIHDVEQDRSTFHQPLCSETAREVIEMARSIEPSVVVSIEVLDKWYTDHDDPAFKTETARRFKPDYIGPLNLPLSLPITKLMLLFHAERLSPVRDAIVTEFAGRAAFPQSDATIIQVVHAEVDKAAALALVAAGYGIAPERVCAIGDAPNDAGMLQWAGLGCAVASAFGGARDAADVILEQTNDERAVGLAIERYVLDDDPVARQVALAGAPSQPGT